MRTSCVFLLVSLGLGCASADSGVDSPSTDPTISVETGMASYYAHKFHGRTTASGEVYDENALTAAHRRLPFGTRVRVTNLENDRSVTLRVNDRGPFVEGRIIDVSYRAAEDLDFIQAGLARVQVEVVSTP